MAYNHKTAQMQFKADWEKAEQTYRAAGMSEQAIQAMYAFEKQVFNSERRFREHSLPFADLLRDGAQDKLPDVLRHTLGIPFGDIATSSQHDWVETIGDAALAAAIKRLTPKEIEMLTLWCIVGLSKAEIGRMEHVTGQAIGQRIKRITKKIKKFL